MCIGACMCVYIIKSSAEELYRSICTTYTHEACSGTLCEIKTPQCVGKKRPK